ncbi:hypothetical protein AHF37_05833 [Paragonimus kellicotti]|nr:hypothetical protein AHF37_05833 [Paragonimus kellicotti]
MHSTKLSSTLCLITHVIMPLSGLKKRLNLWASGVSCEDRLLLGTAEKPIVSWHALVVDGHNVNELLSAFSTARSIKDKPVALLCKTFKGADLPGIADQENWHGKPLGSKSAEVIRYLEAKLKVGASGDIGSTLGRLKPSPPLDDCTPMKLIGSISLPSPPQYKLGEQVATRLAFGNALARLGQACDRVIGLDGDTKNSTFSIKLRDSRPAQFIECFIAEQNLVGVGIGCAVRQRTVPFVSTFGAFLTRAFDQIRMGAVSQTNCNFVGSHAGVSIGEDGPSQMALEDLAMFRSRIGANIDRRPGATPNSFTPAPRLNFPTSPPPPPTHPPSLPKASKTLRTLDPHTTPTAPLPPPHP